MRLYSIGDIAADVDVAQLGLSGAASLASGMAPWLAFRNNNASAGMSTVTSARAVSLSLHRAEAELGARLQFPSEVRAWSTSAPGGGRGDINMDRQNTNESVRKARAPWCVSLIVVACC